MTVVFDRPPIFAEVERLIGPEVADAYFTWNGKIYSPSGKTPPREIVMHERVHAIQQGGLIGSGRWWRRWIDEPSFRLDQEARAYAVQLQWVQRFRPNEWRDELRDVVEMLSGSLYGGVADRATVQRLVLAR